MCPVSASSACKLHSAASQSHASRLRAASHREMPSGEPSPDRSWRPGIPGVWVSPCLRSGPACSRFDQMSPSGGAMLCVELVAVAKLPTRNRRLLRRVEGEATNVGLEKGLVFSLLALIVRISCLVFVLVFSQVSCRCRVWGLQVVLPVRPRSRFSVSASGKCVPYLHCGPRPNKSQRIDPRQKEHPQEIFETLDGGKSFLIVFLPL